MKRQREEFLFSVFQEKYQAFDNFKHTDKPDFLVFNHSETIGIEFTELYKQSRKNGKTPREVEAIKERVLNNAKKMSIKENIPPLKVAIIFTKNIEKNRENYLTEELFKIIKNNYPKESGKVDIHNDFNNQI